MRAQATTTTATTATTASAPPPTPVPAPTATTAPRRLGPRPLALHMTSQLSTLMSSHAALPYWNAGLLSWKPHLAKAAAELKSQLDGVAPEAFADAVEAEAHRRFDTFLHGLDAYRHHAYRRPPPDMRLAWTCGTTRLWDYAKPGASGPAVLVVPSLVNRAYILDLTPARSLMRHLAAKGLRPYLLDWDAPGPIERKFTLTDYVAARLEPALDVVLAEAGRPSVVGYCMGGTLAVALAARRGADLRRMALLAAPWDFHAEGEREGRMALMAETILSAAIDLAGGLTVDMLQTLFTSLDPTLVGRKFRSFARMRPGSARAREFVVLEDWLNDGVPLAAAVAKDCLFGWYGRNTPALGRWVIDGQPVSPADVAVPTLVMVPERDRIVPPASALALAEALPQARRMVVPTGHIGMVSGSRAKATVYTPLTRWVSLTT